VDEYLEPNGERVVDDEEMIEDLILQEIVDAYDEDEEDNEGINPALDFKRVTHAEVMAAMKIRIEWEEQNGDGDGNKLLALEREMAKLELHKVYTASQGRQASITSFFGS